MTSPLGPIEITGTTSAITDIGFSTVTFNNPETIPSVLLQCKQELEEYFEGKRSLFTVKLMPEGTIFQRKVWSALKKIGYGNTTTYGAIARKLRNPDSVRAVGLANSKNPIAIILPCHRVIGEDGKLTGYAGGLWRKQWLLEHEGNVSGKNPTLF